MVCDVRSARPWFGRTTVTTRTARTVARRLIATTSRPTATTSPRREELRRVERATGGRRLPLGASGVARDGGGLGVRGGARAREVEDGSWLLSAAKSIETCGTKHGRSTSSDFLRRTSEPESVIAASSSSPWPASAARCISAAEIAHACGPPPRPQVARDRAAAAPTRVVGRVRRVRDVQPELHPVVRDALRGSTPPPLPLGDVALDRAPQQRRRAGAVPKRYRSKVLVAATSPRRVGFRRGVVARARRCSGVKK